PFLMEAEQFIDLEGIGRHRTPPATAGQLRQDFPRAGLLLTARLGIAGENGTPAGRVAGAADLEGAVDLEPTDRPALVVIIKVVVDAGTTAQVLQCYGNRVLAGTDGQLEVTGVLDLD